MAGPNSEPPRKTRTDIPTPPPEPGKLDPEAVMERFERAHAKRINIEGNGNKLVDAELDPAVVKAAIRASLGATWNTIVPAKFRDARLSDFDTKARDVLDRWAEASIFGTNLVVTGPPGTGKTHAVFAAARVLVGNGASVAYERAGGILRLLDWHNPDSTQRMNALASVDVLIIDDLGVAAPNDWAMSQWDELFDRRWANDLPIAATANGAGKDLIAAIGARPHSRLTGGATMLRLSGIDQRSTNE